MGATRISNLETLDGFKLKSICPADVNAGWDVGFWQIVNGEVVLIEEFKIGFLKHVGEFYIASGGFYLSQENATKALAKQLRKRADALEGKR